MFKNRRHHRRAHRGFFSIARHDTRVMEENRSTRTGWNDADFGEDYGDMCRRLAKVGVPTESFLSAGATQATSIDVAQEIKDIKIVLVFLFIVIVFFI